jgi:hypothetical protein
MALSRGAKIALGCGIAFVAVTGVIAVVVVGAAWWGIGKAKQVAQQFEGEQKHAEEALRRANANPFTPPADGVIAEDRLVRFLAVRKRMYSAYVKHKEMIEAQANKKDPDLSALARLPGILMELRAAKAEALAQQSMSENEFGWLQLTVYKNLAMAGVTQGGPQVSDAVGAVGEEVAAEAEKAADAAQADPNVPAETRRQLREAAKQVREQAGRGTEASRTLDVPPANMALFKKHRDEILQYTMGGLELIPL